MVQGRKQKEVVLMYVVLLVSDSCDTSVYGTFSSIDKARSFVDNFKWRSYHKDSYLEIEKVKEVKS